MPYSKALSFNHGLPGSPRIVFPDGYKFEAGDKDVLRLSHRFGTTVGVFFFLLVFTPVKMGTSQVV